MLEERVESLEEHELFLKNENESFQFQINNFETDVAEKFCLDVLATVNTMFENANAYWFIF